LGKPEKAELIFRLRYESEKLQETGKRGGFSACFVLRKNVRGGHLAAALLFCRRGTGVDRI
jgi:hypothetical protein